MFPRRPDEDRTACRARVLVMLACIRTINAVPIGQLLAVYQGRECAAIVPATSNGKPGHPVIYPAVLFDGLRRLTGDAGARSLMEASQVDIRRVEIGEAALFDVDTPDALVKSGGVLRD